MPESTMKQIMEAYKEWYESQVAEEEASPGTLIPAKEA